MGNLLTQIRQLFPERHVPETDSSTSFDSDSDGEQEEMRILNKKKVFRYPSQFRTHVFYEDESPEENRRRSDTICRPSPPCSGGMVDVGAQIGPPVAFRRQSIPPSKRPLAPTKAKSVAFQNILANTSPFSAPLTLHSVDPNRLRPCLRSDAFRDEPPSVRYRIAGSILPPSLLPTGERQVQERRLGVPTPEFLQVPLSAAPLIKVTTSFREYENISAFTSAAVGGKNSPEFKNLKDSVEISEQDNDAEEVLDLK